ncbi:MAG TPA: hypothetical protein ENI85_07690 [Deltaproteobacteria bacterium]|nr:hypothetical protein [Deltaproteobacteria bacterium]
MDVGLSTGGGGAGRRTLPSDLFWTLAPLLVLAFYAWPMLGYMLPGYESLLGENYQPLRALKFYASLGGETHKYGPMPNFVLLPVYGISLAYWWLEGTFTGPSGDFPYGLAHPLEQLSWLIFAGRLLFMLIGLGLYAWLLVALRRMGVSRVAIALAFLTCVGTNYAAAYFLANTRPDGLCYAFVAASMGVYVRILFDGPTLRRGVLLSLLAVFAISSKELAGPVYVLPYLGLGWMLVRRARRTPSTAAEQLRIAGASIAAGVIGYLVLNVVYAPAAWWTRMSHWLGGPGTSKDVWMEGGTAALDLATRISLIGNGFLDTLGPGGSILTLIALGAVMIFRPRHSGMLILPFASVLALGLWPLGFPGDRFYGVGTVTLVPVVGLGMDVLWRHLHGRGIRGLAIATSVVLLLSNGVFATWAWHKLEGLPQRVIERSLAAEVPRFEGTLNVLNIHPAVPGKSRLSDQGYRVDGRSLRELVEADPATLPDRIYTDAGSLAFIEYARQSPARAELFRSQGFEIDDWPGIEALGYRPLRVIRTGTPGWFPFDWMPAVEWRRRRSPVSVFERVTSARARANPDSMGAAVSGKRAVGP